VGGTPAACGVLIKTISTVTTSAGKKARAISYPGMALGRRRR
jgi:hypothetical protein